MPWAAMASGVAGGAVTIALGTIIAAFMSRAGATGGNASPLVAVGGAFVVRTPAWLKDFAIAAFGTGDKVALFVGMGLVLLLLCAAVGAVGAPASVGGAGMPVPALVTFVLIGALGLAAVLSRPGAEGTDVIPTVLGTVAGMGVLASLWRWGQPLPSLSGYGTAPGRRQVLRWGGALALIGVVAAVGGHAFGQASQRVRQARATLRVPSVTNPVMVADDAQLEVPGISDFVTDNDVFYRIDTALTLPQVDTDGWALRVHGLVDQEVVLDWESLLSKPMQESMVTLTCVSNQVGGDLVGNAVWTGWPVRELLAMAGVRPEADMVLSTSADGWTAGTPLVALTDERDALLAVGMNGEPLPVSHGFPARLVVPGLYGYVSATKWVVDLKVTTFADDVAYWTTRGWAERGPIKIASRIDVPRSGDTTTPGEDGTLPIAGVAWAQQEGISAVEVQVDDGPWQEARLAAEPSIDAWRQWVLRWDASPGAHTARVRATDGDGEVQTEAEAPPIPDGASGWHTVTFTVG